MLSLMTSLSSQTRPTQRWPTHSLAFPYMKLKGDHSVLASSRVHELIIAIGSRCPNLVSVQTQGCSPPGPRPHGHLQTWEASRLPHRAQSQLSGDQGAAVGLARRGGGGGAELGEAAGAGFQAGHGAPGEEGRRTHITFWW